LGAGRINSPMFKPISIMGLIGAGSKLLTHIKKNQFSKFTAK